jgi:carbonic anhydrase
LPIDPSTQARYHARRFIDSHREVQVMVNYRSALRSCIAFSGIIMVFACRAADQPKPAAESPASTAPPQRAHWGYEAEHGPALWATLDSAYVECGQGQSQSPIDITSPQASGHPVWAAEYGTTNLRIAHHQQVEDILDNGHTIQVDYSEGSVLTIGEETFELKQFHFHTPSENTVNGSHYPMEMHMVHQSAGGGLAVYGVFFEAGEHHPGFDLLTAHLPSRPGEKHDLKDVELDLNALLPTSHNAYHFSGSLTTPPCSEGVQWLVAVEPVAMSEAQLSEFSRRLGHNNRPVQPLNGRTITVDRLD